MARWWQKWKGRLDGGQDPVQAESQAHKTLAAVLELFGADAFDLDQQSAAEVQAQFDHWARHVMQGRPVPGHPEQVAGRRYFESLKAFVLEHRQREKNFVQRTFAEVRAALWRLTAVVVADFRSGRDEVTQVDRQLAALKEALTSQNADRIREVASSTVSVIQELNAQRQQRQASAIREMGDTLRQLRQQLETARAEAERDALTGVFNRRGFDEQVQQVVHLSLMSGRPATVLMIDIDFFKKINDTYGHQAGDEVLATMGRVLNEAFPRRGDVVARYGGEEFAVLLTEDDHKVAQTLGQRLVEKVRETEFHTNKGVIPVTISIGAAELQAGEDPKNWIGRADQALYNAKEGGRDRLRVAA